MGIQALFEPQGEGKLKLMYDAMSERLELGSFDDFVKNLKNPDVRTSIYRTASEFYELGDYETFVENVEPALEPRWKAVLRGTAEYAGKTLLDIVSDLVEFDVEEKPGSPETRVFQMLREIDKGGKLRSPSGIEDPDGEATQQFIKDPVGTLKHMDAAGWFSEDAPQAPGLPDLEGASVDPAKAFTSEDPYWQAFKQKLNEPLIPIIDKIPRDYVPGTLGIAEILPYEAKQVLWKVARGAIGFAENAVTPMNIGIFAALIANPVAALGRIAGAYFALDMAKGSVMLFEQMIEQLKRGEGLEAVETGTQALLSSAATIAAVRHAVGPQKAKPKPVMDEYVRKKFEELDAVLRENPEVANKLRSQLEMVDELIRMDKKPAESPPPIVGVKRGTPEFTDYIAVQGETIRRLVKTPEELAKPEGKVELIKPGEGGPKREIVKLDEQGRKPSGEVIKPGEQKPGRQKLEVDEDLVRRERERVETLEPETGREVLRVAIDENGKARLQPVDRQSVLKPGEYVKMLDEARRMRKELEQGGPKEAPPKKPKRKRFIPRSVDIAIVKLGDQLSKAKLTAKELAKGMADLNKTDKAYVENVLRALSYLYEKYPRVMEIADIAGVYFAKNDTIMGALTGAKGANAANTTLSNGRNILVFNMGVPIFDKVGRRAPNLENVFEYKGIKYKNFANDFPSVFQLVAHEVFHAFDRSRFPYFQTLYMMLPKMGGRLAIKDLKLSHAKRLLRAIKKGREELMKELGEIQREALGIPEGMKWKPSKVPYREQFFEAYARFRATRVAQRVQQDLDAVLKQLDQHVIPRVRRTTTDEFSRGGEPLSMPSRRAGSDPKFDRFKELIDDLRAKTNMTFEQVEAILRDRYGEAVDSYIRTYKELLEPKAQPVAPIKEVEGKKPVDDVAQPKKGSVRERLEAYSEELAQLRDTAARIGQFVYDLFSVEGRFRRIGAEKTGNAVKRWASVIGAETERALGVARRVAKRHRHDELELSLVTLVAEDARVLRTIKDSAMRRRIAESAREVRKYFDEIQQMYKDYGVEVDFVKRLRRELESEIQDRMAKKQPVDDLKAALEDLRNLKFVHIPVSLWFNTLLKNDPVRLRRAVRLMAERRRSTLRIRDFVTEGLLGVNEVSIVDVLVNYGRRTGKDFALLEVLKAAQEENLAVRVREGMKAPVEYVDPPSRGMPFKEFKVHPLLKDWMIELSDYGGFNLLDKGLGAIKVAQFYNPFFLGAYDLIQGTMLGAHLKHAAGAAVGLAVGGAPGLIAGAAIGEALSRGLLIRSLQHVMRRSPEYVEAQKLGLSSKPFPDPYDSVMHQLQATKTSFSRKLTDFITDAPVLAAIKRARQGDRLARIIAGLTPLPWLADLYKVSWSMAWALDSAVRFSTYSWLVQKKGFAPAEAAQLAARFHADYASVPMKTRKWMNRFFFTPTFETVMGKLYIDMATAVPKALIKPGSLSKSERILATGLVRTAGVLLAMDMVMKAWGFDDDEFGVRYRRRVETDEGFQDLVIVFSNPANIFVKEFERVYQSMKRSTINVPKELLRRFKWRFHPVYRVVSEVIANKDPNGDFIYSPFDPHMVKALKSMWYLARNFVPMVQLVTGAEDQEKARRELAEATNDAFELVMRPFTFQYLRGDKQLAAISRIKYYQQLYRQMIRNGQIEPEEAAAQLKLLMEVIEDEMQNLQDEDVP